MSGNMQGQNEALDTGSSSAALTTNNPQDANITNTNDKQVAKDGEAQNEEERQPKRTKKRFEIKRWTAVAFWSWDQTNEICAICRNHLMEPCIDCLAKADTDSTHNHVDCPIAAGRCGHRFHMHCISTWIKTRNTCPLDSAEWALKEVINN